MLGKRMPSASCQGGARQGEGAGRWWAAWPDSGAIYPDVPLSSYQPHCTSALIRKENCFALWLFPALGQLQWLSPHSCSHLSYFWPNPKAVNLKERPFLGQYQWQVQYLPLQGLQELCALSNTLLNHPPPPSVLKGLPTRDLFLTQNH